MDGYLMQVFDSLEEAQACLAAVNAIADVYWKQNGYTVVDGALVGKNAATGEDMPEAARTTTWALIEDMGGGKFGFYSPSNRQEFKNWKTRLEQHLGFTAVGEEVLVQFKEEALG